MHAWLKVATPTCAVAVAAVAALSGGSTAQADTPGCVSKKEYRKVRVADSEFKGMTMRRVHTTILNTDGTQRWVSPLLGPSTSRHREQMRQYEFCGNGDGYVLIGYTTATNDGHQGWLTIGKWADWNG